MRSLLLTAYLALFSFSAVAQESGSAVLPPFQAKRLPPEKPDLNIGAPASLEAATLAEQLSTIQNDTGAPQQPGSSSTLGGSPPAGFKLRTDVRLSKTALDAVQMSEKWMAKHNQPLGS